MNSVDFIDLSIIKRLDFGQYLSCKFRCITVLMQIVHVTKPALLGLLTSHHQLRSSVEKYFLLLLAFVKVSEQKKVSNNSLTHTSCLLCSLKRRKC